MTMTEKAEDLRKANSTRARYVIVFVNSLRYSTLIVAADDTSTLLADSL